MFNKDLLLIDIEATGLDVDRHEMIQLAAVLLDRTTLREKKHFSSFIRPVHWKTRQPKAMEVNKISYDTVKQAPLLKTVIRKFRKTFPPQTVILANYGGILDITFLRKAFKQSAVPYIYDYHIFNLWGLFYTYLAKQKKLRNKKKFAGFGLENLAQIFSLNMQTHDALDDCRLEAEILRKILKVTNI